LHHVVEDAANRGSLFPADSIANGGADATFDLLEHLKLMDELSTLTFGG
jgi:hypothetical protein